MAWQDTLLDASFRGIIFDCESTRDSARRDVVQHEYPYQDGADAEDLGRKARQLSLTAVFWGDDYDTRLQRFLQALDTPGAGELIHPVFGSIKQAQLLDYSIEHDADSVDACRISLNFVEHTTSQPFFVQQLAAQKAAQTSQLASISRGAGIKAFAGIIARLRALANPAQLAAMRGLLAGTIGAIRAQLQELISVALDLIDAPHAFAADVLGLFSQLADLRGFDAGVWFADWQSLSKQLDSLVLLPEKLAAGESLSDEPAGTVPGMGAGDSTGTGTGSGTGSGAGTGSGTGTGTGTGTGAGSAAGNLATALAGLDGGTRFVTASALPAGTVTAVSLLLQLGKATTLADTAAQLLAIEAEQPRLSPVEIQILAADVRHAVQATIDLYRRELDLETARPVVEALKDTALAEQAAAASIITLRPPLIRRRVEAAANLHLLAHHWYGDYTRAGELARLNPQLTNPNFIAAGDTLNAYAR